MGNVRGGIGLRREKDGWDKAGVCAWKGCGKASKTSTSNV